MARMCKQALNFNSHAHVERDSEEQYRYIREHISTHTLTWSVTFPADYYPYNAGISTHTLTWSVTLCLRSRKHFRSHFNSHAHVERDVEKQFADFDLEISTHTLTWSVTCQICAKKLSGDISTHTLTWSVTR